MSSKRLRIRILEKVLEHLLIEDIHEAGDEFDYHIDEKFRSQAEYYHGEKQKVINECVTFYNGFPDTFAISTLDGIKGYGIDYDYIDEAIADLMALIIWLYNLKDWEYLPPPSGSD